MTVMLVGCAKAPSGDRDGAVSTDSASTAATVTPTMAASTSQRGRDGTVMPPSPPSSSSSSGARPMGPGLSPGTAWVAIANGSQRANAAGLPPEVERLVPDAVKRVQALGENVSLHDVDIAAHPDTIELVFLPRLAPGERLHPGGGTSLGREVHLHYARASGAFIRHHFAR